MSNDLRDYLIEKIMETYEPDEILIDKLTVSLHDLAEEILYKTDIETLKNIVD